MTFGYYDPPHPPEQPAGVYRFNGSNLSARPTLWSAHLIYHELMPGHHLRLALGIEGQASHPILQFISNSAFEEGWAEYAANLGVEMGAYTDPYDHYGHLVAQAFLAARLVVDTGLNDLGWSLQQAQEYLSNHTFSTPAESATEVLRYSTDIPAQALAYRMGYEAFIEGRHRAERALGTRFNVAQFDTAVSDHGSLPPEVLTQQVDFYIHEARGH